MISPALITPPAVALVSLAEAKAHLRVTSADEDTLITGLIGAAMQYLDGWGGVLGRCIMAQTWRVPLTGFTDQYLPFPDPQAAAVKYLDAAEATQTLLPAAYLVGNAYGGGYIQFDPSDTPPATADRDDAIWAEVTFGFPAGANLAGLRVAALMLIGTWYEDREGERGLSPAVSTLIAPFRVQRL